MSEVEYDDYGAPVIPERATRLDHTRSYGNPNIVTVDGRQYPLPHDKGEPCAVVDLLIQHFGEQQGMGILWNFTCFPFDDETAWEQAMDFVIDYYLRRAFENKDVEQAPTT